MFKKKTEVSFSRESWLISENRIALINDLISRSVLIGLAKSEIVELLGDEFNDSNSNVWSYYIGNYRKWISLKKHFLILHFDDQERVVYVSKRSTF
jgi:hypothetical protein